jgi:hypothetical protein
LSTIQYTLRAEAYGWLVMTWSTSRPTELQRLADRLQDAYADAVADPARTEGAETMLGESKGAGQRPAPTGGGGETRTLARLLKGCLVAAMLAP